ncbi:class F sortase [Pseudonocardia sp. CA-107938]|uniref:class F sortase n=1 Tax=Pseudonocardia sp. CA-107938 TaxID=3240021 RepID=UPI003D92683F
MTLRSVLLALLLCGVSAACAPAAEPVVLTGTAVAAPTGHEPVHLDVDAIGVHADVIRLGLAPDRTVEVPPLGSPDVGWYSYSPPPGDLGPAVLLGHVDAAATGPSVFHDLSRLRPGDGIAVRRADGSTVRFRVDDVAQYPKARFPTAAVYGNIDHAGLRLITCGGAFDRGRRSYLDNVVVYASAVPEGAG